MDISWPDRLLPWVTVIRHSYLPVVEVNMAEQKKHLIDYFEKWKDRNEQVDDVLVIGVRL